jgi:glutamine synthetase
MSVHQADDPLVFVATSDLAGLLRGKSFPVSEWARRAERGVGWTPTNVQITCFDTIADSPFGALGDLALVPDPQTRFQLPATETAPALDFALGDIRSLEGEPWAFCTRAIARRAVEELHAAAGVTPLGAFEHEFQVVGPPPALGDGFGFRGFRQAQGRAEALLDAMRRAGCPPDTFMKEYGPAQYEITTQVADGVAVADRAAILRMLTQESFRTSESSASFAPILDPASVGNGVHLHLSFRDDQGHPVGYDSDAPHGLGTTARHFAGGVLAYLDQIVALLAPSDVSYHRLTPHRWSAAFNNLGYRDREAGVRICPVSAKDTASVAEQFHFEVRAMDAAASPHLSLAAVLFAGAQGIRDGIEPPPVTEEDLSELTADELARRGFRRLPASLPEALDRFRNSAFVRDRFGADFVSLYAAHKASELAFLDGLSLADKCARYRDVY